MKSYETLIAAIAKIPEEEFKLRYQKFGGGEGRAYDANSQLADGQRERGQSEALYERENYCSNCRMVNSSFDGVSIAIDCRSTDEEMQEIKHKINLD
jgi:hypothetical protein